jgi:hypothetical protein
MSRPIDVEEVASFCFGREPETEWEVGVCEKIKMALKSAYRLGRRDEANSEALPPWYDS